MGKVESGPPHRRPRVGRTPAQTKIPLHTYKHDRERALTPSSTTYFLITSASPMIGGIKYWRGHPRIMWGVHLLAWGGGKTNRTGGGNIRYVWRQKSGNRSKYCTSGPTRNVAMIGQRKGKEKVRICIEGNLQNTLHCSAVCRNHCAWRQ